jgi:hypothetical protein
MATTIKNQMRPRSFETTLTNAEILALPVTPIVLMPAPGAGFAILFRMGLSRVDDAAGAYTNVDAAGFLRFGLLTLTPTFGSQPVLASDGLIGAGVRTTIYPPYAEVTVTGGAETAIIAQNALALTDLENQPLVFAANNAAAGAFTGGNAANSMILTYYAWIVTL